MALWTWFLALKKQTRLIIIISLIVIIIISILSIRTAYWKYQYFKEQEQKVKVLENEKKQMLKEIITYKTDIKVLKDTISKREKQYLDLKRQLIPIKDGRKKIPDVVKSYPDGKLDSILLNHKHKI